MVSGSAVPYHTMPITRLHPTCYLSQVQRCSALSCVGCNRAQHPQPGTQPSHASLAVAMEPKCSYGYCIYSCVGRWSCAELGQPLEVISLCVRANRPHRCARSDDMWSLDRDIETLLR